MKPYSLVIKKENIALISGILPDINKQTKNNPYLQAESIFQKINTIILDYNLEDYTIINTKLFLKNIQDISEVNKAYHNFFKTNYPTRSALGGVQLVNDALVEIEFTLYKSSSF